MWTKENDLDWLSKGGSPDLGGGWPCRPQVTPIKNSQQTFEHPIKETDTNSNEDDRSNRFRMIRIFVILSKNKKKIV